MANTKISALPAVTTPAVTDQFPVNQGGTTKRMTLAQVRGGSVRVLKFDFAYDTPNLNTGVTVWTPAIGDVLLDAFFSVNTAFDGTTPMADIGQFLSAGTTGVFASLIGTGMLPPLGNADLTTEGPSPMWGLSQELAGSAAYAGGYSGVTTFRTTDPLLLVVSQDGTKGGTAIGGTAGAASLYLVVATPLALN